MYNQFQIKEFLSTTLSYLDDYKLNPVPDNYRLWFEHATADNQALSEEINNLIEQQAAINEELCKKLYKKYLLSADHQDIDNARLAFSHLLNIMIGQLNNWSTNSEEFCKSLKNCTDQLQDSPSVQEIKAVIEEVIRKTEDFSTSNSDINTNMTSLNKEVNKLRKDLAKAGSEAITDPLTGISNRRGLDNKLNHTIEAAKRQHSELAIIMVDIDKFKQINDNFGHQTGDKVLKYVAQLMQRNLRATDFIARFGGEEFMIILPHTGLMGATQVAEHIRQTVSAKPLSVGTKIRTPNGKSEHLIGRITISLGVAQYRLLESVDDLIARADLCMYAAKHEGRNRVKHEETLDNSNSPL